MPDPKPDALNGLFIPDVWYKTLYELDFLDMSCKF
jgi:hypothetical protein